MDELLDLTERTPRGYETGPVSLVEPLTIPIPRFSPEIPALSHARAADGTRTGITPPPPIPARERRASTAPPPIPTAALRPSKPSVEPVDDGASVEVELSEPSVEVAREALEPSEPEYIPPAVLPPLPAPSASWLSSAPTRRPPTQPPFAQFQQPYAQPYPAQQPYAQQPYAPQPVAMPAMPMMTDSMASSWFARASREWTARHFAVVVIVAIALVSVLYVAFSGDHGAPSTTPVADTTQPAAPVAEPVAAPAPVDVAPAPVAPAVAPVVAPVAPAFASVPITSVPVGAVVTLVTDGNATVIGKTPVTASIDPTRSYDVVLAVRGQPTQMRHIDANTREVLRRRSVATPCTGCRQARSTRTRSSERRGCASGARRRCGAEPDHPDRGRYLDVIDETVVRDHHRRQVDASVDAAAHDVAVERPSHDHAGQQRAEDQEDDRRPDRRAQADDDHARLHAALVVRRRLVRGTRRRFRRADRLLELA